MSSQNLTAAQIEETFAELNAAQISWLKANSKRWEVPGRVRYYIQKEAALALGKMVDEEKKGQAVAILGLSKNKSFKELLSWGVYFDAVAGRMVKNDTRDMIYDAFCEAFAEIN